MGTIALSNGMNLDSLKELGENELLCIDGGWNVFDTLGACVVVVGAVVAGGAAIIATPAVITTAAVCGVVLAVEGVACTYFSDAYATRYGH